MSPEKIPGDMQLSAVFSQQDLREFGEWYLGTVEGNALPDEDMNRAIARFEPDPEKAQRYTYAAHIFTKHIPDLKAIGRRLEDIESVSVWENDDNSMVTTKFVNPGSNN